jgi:tetratricopeptide (TPR) repeat protein
MDEVTHQDQMIERYGAGDAGMSEDQDYDKAVSYCTSILKNCPSSLSYAYKKIEYLLRSNQLKEADSYSSELYKSHENVPGVMSWRGRVLIYNGADVLGKKILQQCIQFDPD